MFSDCIRDKVHPATWAVVGIKKEPTGSKVSLRGTAFAVDVFGHLLTCWHVTYMDTDNTEEPDYFEILQPGITPRSASGALARHWSSPIRVQGQDPGLDAMLQAALLDQPAGQGRVLPVRHHPAHDVL